MHISFYYKYFIREQSNKNVLEIEKINYIFDYLEKS